jgi:uncharacterized protein
MVDPIPSLEPASPSPTPAPPAPNTLFRGPDGIRSGWRVAIYLVLAAVVGFLIVLIAGLLARGRNLQVTQITPLGTMLSEAAIFLGTAIPALIMARIEHRKFGDYGLPGQSMLGRNFWIGVVVGFVSISACLLGIFAFGGFRLTGFGIHGSAIPAATLSWAIAFLIVGLAEEFSFRGYLQFTLTTGMGFWPSAFLLSALFGLAHSRNPGESNAGLVSVVLFGLLFCLFLRRTGNLWWAVGFHAGWDWGQTFFYGVPDSGMIPYHNLFNCAFAGPRWLTGGTVGPEASIFTPIVLVIAAIVFSRVYRENKYQTDRSPSVGGQAN